MAEPSKGTHVTEEKHSPTMPHDKTDKLGKGKGSKGPMMPDVDQDYM